MDNASFRQLLIAEEQKSADTTTPIVTTGDGIEQPKIDASLVPEFVEDMLGMFNSIKYGFPNGMSEQKYKDLLGELANNFKYIQDALPELKTNKQVKQEREEENRRFEEQYKNNSAKTDSDWDWDQWNDIKWEEIPEEEQKNGRSL